MNKDEILNLIKEHKEEQELLEAGKFKTGYRLLRKAIFGRPNFVKLKAKYGANLSPSVAARKEIRDAKAVIARRIEKHPGSKISASDKQKAKLQKIVNKTNDKIVKQTEVINNSRQDLAKVVNKNRKNALLKGSAIGAGGIAGAAGINNVGQKVRQDMKYKSNKSVSKTCSQMYSNPEAIAKCKKRLYNKYKVSKLRQGIDTVVDKAKNIVGK